MSAGINKIRDFAFSITGRNVATKQESEKDPVLFVTRTNGNEVLFYEVKRGTATQLKQVNDKIEDLNRRHESRLKADVDVRYADRLESKVENEELSALVDAFTSILRKEAGYESIRVLQTASDKRYKAGDIIERPRGSGCATSGKSARFSSSSSRAGIRH